MALTLSELRENLDGLGYYLGPRGLLGLGNTGGACDLSVLGSINCAVTTLRDVPSLDGYTQAAIYQFQVDNNIVANGQNGADLQDRVERAVRIVQNNLKIVTGISLPITGRYRDQTIAAMKRFQSNRRLPVTGFAPHSVRKLLDDDARRITGGGSPSPSPSPTPPTGELAELRRFKDDLSQLKGKLFRREITETEFTRLVYDRIP